MMKRYFFLSLLLCIGITMSVQAQNDPDAAALLNKMSAKYKALPATQTNFTLSVHEPDAKTDISKKGTLLLKGSKFSLKIDNLVSTCDGKNIWNYLPLDKQIQISLYDKDDDAISPEKFFTLWEKNFIYRVKENATVKGKACTIIELSPTLKNANYFKVELCIEKESLTPLYFRVFEKNGVRTTYTIDSIVPATDVNDKTFTLDPKKYPGVEVVDLR
jgi:outer membrane lipoprotein carrier protein